MSFLYLFKIDVIQITIEDILPLNFVDLVILKTIS
jgi:hypothetical protein